MFVPKGSAGAMRYWNQRCPNHLPAPTVRAALSVSRRKSFWLCGRRRAGSPRFGLFGKAEPFRSRAAEPRVIVEQTEPNLDKPDCGQILETNTATP